jgi:hypothetical protein
MTIVWLKGIARASQVCQSIITTMEAFLTYPQEPTAVRLPN